MSCEAYVVALQSAWGIKGCSKTFSSAWNTAGVAMEKGAFASSAFSASRNCAAHSSLKSKRVPRELLSWFRAFLASRKATYCLIRATWMSGTTTKSVTVLMCAPKTWAVPKMLLVALPMRPDRSTMRL